MKKSDYVVVGAGIGGLLAARVILEHSPSATVTLIERGSAAGGLLRSTCYDDLWFDYGTHIPELTSNPALNDLLFPADACHDWIKIPRLRVGNYHGGHLNSRSQFIDISHDRSLSDQAIGEILRTTAILADDCSDLGQYATQRFGSTAAERVIGPVMKKLTACELDELSPFAIRYYGLSRLIYGDRTCSVNLKSIAHLDEVLAYADDSERPRQSSWLYPPAGHGVGHWIDTLQKKVMDGGVDLLLGTSIDSVVPGKIGYTVVTREHDDIEASHLIWTVPAYTGLQGAMQCRPQSRAVAIYHFSSITRPSTELDYLYCYEPEMASYRFTFYDNVQRLEGVAEYRLSVEVICDDPSEVSPGTIAEEVARIGLYRSSEQLRHVATEILPFGFPIPRAGDEGKHRLVYERVREENRGVVFTGRGVPGIFFMTDVLPDVYGKLKTLIGD